GETRILRPEVSQPRPAFFHVAARTGLLIVLPAGTARRGCSLRLGHGPLCRRILERGPSPCLRMLRDVSVCPDTSPKSDRTRFAMAASAKSIAQVESVRSASHEYSSEHVSQRACRSEPCCCPGT